MSVLVDQLRAYRDLHGLSNMQLSTKLGVPKSTVRKWFSSGESHTEPSSANELKIQRLISLDEGGLTDIYPDMFGIPEPAQSPARDTTVEDTGRADEIRAASRQKVPALSKIDELLEPYKTFRDAIHDDIRLTKLEVQIIDTKEFQRLRRLKQLSSAYLVYPCAVHTRFEHSIGTLEQAEKIIRKVNENPKREEEIGPEARLLIRLVALLHDITYAPFGHELEDEAKLIDGHEKRYRQLLGRGTRIGDILIECLGPGLADEVVRTLEAKGDDQINLLKYPFASDIVLNTVCADLLDYVKRDNYFTGLKETFGERFMSYFVITPVPITADKGNHREHKRLAIRLKKGGMLRRDVMSEIIQLLRSRYSLGEKVYYHHTKQITSAMVSKAVYLSNLHKDVSKLCQMGDEELINEIEKLEKMALGGIACSLKKRDIYKAIYWVSLDTAKYQQPMLVDALHVDPDERAKVEAELAGACSIAPEDVIIYCPKSEMALKEAAVRVKWLDDTTLPLNSIRDNPPSGEVKEISDKHYALWRFCVLLKASLVDEKGQELADACFHRWCMLNDNPLYRIPGKDQASKTLWQLALEEKLAAPEIEELEAIANLDKSGPPQTIDGWRELRQSLKTQATDTEESDS